MKNIEKLYFDSKRKFLFKKITMHPEYIFYKATKYGMKYYNSKKSNQIIKILYYGRIMNRIASKYGIELYGKYEEGLRIWHGPIVINSNVTIGKNCSLHGNNCIGNNGITKDCPKIGNNVDIGFGTIIIGDVRICDNVIIGANSLVNKDIEEPGVYVGSPVKKIK